MKVETYEKSKEPDTGKSYLVSVAPLTRIPLLRDQAFFYTSPSNPPVGSLVEIPIGRRSTRGIVTAVQSDFARASGITLKPISKVLQRAFLTPQQLTLAKFISAYYYCSLGTVLKYFVPDRMRARNPVETLPFTSLRPITLSSQLQKILTRIDQDLHKGTCSNLLLLQTTFSNESKDALICIIQNALIAHDDQILVLVSEKTQIDPVREILAESFPASIITTLSTTMTKGAFYESWERIRGTNPNQNDSIPRIIIGSRSALFAPFLKLSTVIVTESHDDAYKQWDAMPRYDARRCALELSRIHNCGFLEISASPRISDLNWHTHNKSYFSLPHRPKPRTTIIDMKIEYNEVNEKRHTKSHPVIARALAHEIERTLQKKQQVLLFLNHQGKNAFSVCIQCKTVARCPQCERALVESNRGHHRCLHCSFVSAVFPRCSDCSSITFKTVGLGTETIEEEIAKKFPQSRVARVDAQSMQKRTSHQKLYEKSISGEIDIVIGTQMSTKGWSLPQLGLAAIIDMDSLLGGLDYSTHEKAYAHVLQLYSRLTLSQSRAPQLFVQVYDTEHDIVRKIQSSNEQGHWQEFVDEELSMRQVLHFPPFANLVKLTYQTTKKSTKDDATRAVYDQCVEACVGDRTIIVSEPHEPLVNKVRTKYRSQIIIKIKKDPAENEASIPQPLHEVFLSLNKDWTIDRDPAHLS